IGLYAAHPVERFLGFFGASLVFGALLLISLALASQQSIGRILGGAFRMTWWGAGVLFRGARFALLHVGMFLWVGIRTGLELLVFVLLAPLRWLRGQAEEEEEEEVLPKPRQRRRKKVAVEEDEESEDDGLDFDPSQTVVERRNA